MAEFKVSVVDSTTVSRRLSNRPSKYDAIIEHVVNLDAGESVLVQVPRNVEPSGFRNLLNNSIRHHLERLGVDREAIRFYLTADNTAVEIYIRTEKEIQDAKKRSMVREKGGK